MPYRRISDPARLHALLEAVFLIESELGLDAMLRHIVEAACTLSGARYGVLGVLHPKERRIMQFVTVGVSDALIAEIGDHPQGKGILGLLIDEPEPIRIADLSSHPKSVGFPANHPPMRSFIGVPVRIRDQVFGNLYLTDKHDASEFGESDLDLIESLALAAGIAIANARLHEQCAS